MSVHPFIEGEKQGGHRVKRAGELLGVSRAAFYERRTAAPGPRAVRDAELAGQIAAVHARSRGSYEARRGCTRSCGGTVSGADGGGWPG